MSKKRVFIGMSGGVDSSTAALLLKKQGYDVTGITIQAVPEGMNKEENLCCGFDAIYDAKRVCGMLGIPHYVINLRKDFNKHVINDFIREYTSGRTPNPCVRCNKYIKFDILLNKIRALGGGYFATGHYARIKKSGRSHMLLKGTDSEKDQSYFLYAINKKYFKYILFPLGNINKNEVRKIAKKNGLPMHSKHDSQGICFVPDKDYKTFIQSHSSYIRKKGDVIMGGKKIGEHRGIINYTIGQRRGLGIAYGIPIYVVGIDAKSNTVYVAKRGSLRYNKIEIKDTNLLTSKKSISSCRKSTLKIRHICREIPVKKTVCRKDSICVHLKNNIEYVPLGQSAVLYNKDTVLGGGIIQSASYTECGDASVIYPERISKGRKVHRS
ncbi:tRNA 2-thiouridine(34) synthase MnmA [Spirochaetota bacterium]